MTWLSNNELLNKYPMRRSGGLFLILIGMTLLLSLLFSREEIVNHKIFAIGTVVSILSFTTVNYFTLGKPRRYQIIALGVALGIEFVLFIVLLNTLPPGTSERDNWLYGSIIVGVHFLPMTFSFGKVLIFLSFSCIITAAFGLLAPQIPYEVFGSIDGILKLVVGVIMFRIVGD